MTPRPAIISIISNELQHMKNQKFSILYVDDEEINLRVFRNTFEDEFEVFTATTGREGLNIFRSNLIDLIITDQRMPGMTGVEFLKEIIELNPEPNRILLTGFSDIDALSSAVNEGKIFQYINKPWDEAELKPVIYQALESYYIKRENQLLTKSLKEKTLDLEKEINAKNELLEQLRLSEQNLRIAKEKAEESEQLKTAFLNNISHEIRTPLSGLIGFANLLNDPDVSHDECKSYLKIINESGERLLQVIDDIITIAIVEAGQEVVNNVKTDLKKVFADMYEIYSKKAVVKNLSFRIFDNTCNQNNLVITDDIKLRRILKALLCNAAKFTKAGFFELSCSMKNGSLIFCVKDSGIGIAPEHHQMIFERFRQVTPTPDRVNEGNGLGLSIARSFVELMNGTIWVKSDIGQGAEFHFSIPYQPLTRNEKYPANSHAVQGENETQPVTVLIAESEYSSFVFLKLLLKPYKFRVIHTETEKDTISAFENNPDIGLAFIDTIILESSGYKLAHRMKELKPSLPVVALIAHSYYTDHKRVIKGGCDMMLAKPIHQDELKTIVEKYLE
ncbi:MAG: hybrid sensor histidine kinase/response regulator [Sphingobacteriia bacterium]|nr:hybrid sensor histidine kinase/response regulator [Sphingobacteriia bacterium]